MTAVGLVMAGCLGPDREDGNKSPDPTMPEFGHVHSWSNSADSFSFVAVEIVVENKTKYKVTFTTDDIWERSRAWYYFGAIVQKTYDTGIERATFDTGADTSCDEGTLFFEACEPGTLRDGAKTVMRSTLRPGTFLVFAAAFGATTPSIKIEAEFEHEVSIGWVQEGTTRLLIMEPRGNASESFVRFNDSVSWNSTGPFFALFRTAGDRLQEPSYEVQGADGTTRTFRPDVHDYETDGDQFVIGDPGFSANGGKWTVTALGGAKSPEGPSMVVLGLLENPRFVLPDGRMKAFGDSP